MDFQPALKQTCSLHRQQRVLIGRTADTYERVLIEGDFLHFNAWEDTAGSMFSKTNRASPCKDHGSDPYPHTNLNRIPKTIGTLIF